MSMQPAVPALDLHASLRPVPRTAVLTDPDWFTWGASMTTAADGRFHLFYSRWPRTCGFAAWVTHSEIAHAVADHPLGPYRFVDVALPARGAEWWDGLCTHNPTILSQGGRFYLYYMGNTGDGQCTEGRQLNWLHRNNQRIGVAIADRPEGPWTRADSPVIDVGADASAPDALMTSNPAVAIRPDGGVLMVYKAVGLARPLPMGGPVVHCVALAERPEGPFTKMPGTVFRSGDEPFPAEDPFIWYQEDQGVYYAIVKDMAGHFTGAGRSLALFVSADGLQWRVSEKPLVADLGLRWADGTVSQMKNLERPQLWRQDGRPAVLFLAADETRENTFNVHVPLSGLCWPGLA